jgi:hypothetical protein
MKSFTPELISDFYMFHRFLLSVIFIMAQTRYPDMPLDDPRRSLFVLSRVKHPGRAYGFFSMSLVRIYLSLKSVGSTMLSSGRYLL